MFNFTRIWPPIKFAFVDGYSSFNHIFRSKETPCLAIFSPLGFWNMASSNGIVCIKTFCRILFIHTSSLWLNFIWFTPCFCHICWYLLWFANYSKSSKCILLPSICCSLCYFCFACFQIFMWTSQMAWCLTLNLSFFSNKKVCPSLFLSKQKWCI